MFLFGLLNCDLRKLLFAEINVGKLFLVFSLLFSLFETCTNIVALLCESFA